MYIFNLLLDFFALSVLLMVLMKRYKFIVEALVALNLLLSSNIHT